MLTFTYDLEDHAPSPSRARHEPITDRLLEWLEQRGVRATVFVVGELASSSRTLVARIAAAGHELAVHGWRHVPMRDLNEASATAELAKARELVEDIAGVSVTGFRAPIFSLTPETPWVPDALAAAGYAWSSSVLPAPNPLHGFPGVPMTPFGWPSGIIELPCPVAGFGSLRVPFLGGVYVRYIPVRMARIGLRRLPAAAVRWSYVHPYDLDPDEPFYVLPHANWLTSRIVHARRRDTLRRVELLARESNGFGPPLGERVTALAAGPPLASLP